MIGAAGRGAARRTPPWALAAVLGVAYLLLDPRTSDLAAQEYRAGLWAQSGFLLWDNGWYSGHHVPAYSLLFPPLGALLGPQVVGALSSVGGTWAFGRLTGGASRLAGAWCALGFTGLLVAGRLTFALGAAIGLGALAVARAAGAGDNFGGSSSSAPVSGTRGLEPPRLGRAKVEGVGQGRGVWGGAVALAALSSVASPVAGAFVALAAAAWWLGDRSARRVRTVVLAGAAVAPAAALAALFPEGGTFPFVLSSFAPTFAVSLLALALAWRGPPVLRAGIALSIALLLVAWALPNPMGGNAARLGATFAGPALAAALLPAGRWRALALAAPLLLWWQLAAPIDDWRASARDPTVRERSYAGLERFLQGRPGPPFRVEVPFTDNHWEAAHLAGGADGFPLARGWERQLDRKVNGLFYDGEPLTPTRYRDWLDDNAVRFVALADAPVDYSAAAEAQLVRDGLPWLRRVYADATWTVWEVRDAAPMGVSALTADGFTTPGAGPVRIRWSPYFEVVSGRGCVRRTADDHVMTDAAVTVRARLSAGGALRREEHCSTRG